jgi:hypothetical protein
MAYRYIDNDGEEAIKFEYGKWNNLLGYECPQCHCFCPFPEGGEKHDNDAKNNGGICPRVIK